DPSTTPVVEIPVDVQIDPQGADAPLHAHAHHHHHDYPVSPDHDLVDHDPSIVHTPYAPHDHDQAGHDLAPADHDHDAPAAAPQAESAPARAVLPHFEMTIGSSPDSHGAVTQNGSGNAGGASANFGHAGDDAPVAESAVSSRATLVAGGVPAYPAEAREADVEADVPLEIVVDASGNVKSARPTEHAGYGLEDAAITAVRRYRFSPAERGGHPVAVRMRWVVAFRLK
ncbi:MAG: energy transducer TonB, partial [Polyangiaceae bacterium]